MKRFLSGLLALVMVVSIGLTGCAAGDSANGISGNYQADTLALVGSLRNAITMADSDPAKRAAQADARAKINSYASHYRRDTRVAGLNSYTTMRTALNSLAAHYSAYPNRPVPEKLQKRLETEFRQVEAALNRGA
ncbi:MAG: photosystem II protein Psb27 [Limnothrix sp.]|uniref:Photosystem II lipoprotein Psb27 n=1 Tax=Limnothrix redekei LRLZ20PSL1 TaxID=3112953 RepID=A0ABW7C7K2_9CYAN|nr:MULTISPECIES: photosystem II protein Psb27 [unclassified Limnothrix]MEB3117999.1 photosystem II protein Psb27 [Limnothrix sp.]OCQ97593.1 photosystem II protein Psb27 [Limnothrix sp. P13C2]MBD2159636.1 photosystem II protein Psb27 [Limnothrix sp. FACHB-1083]MBD2190338.1 photosystem II protein Psb27 [Limnothrix sp. FACHB-1088]MBD2551675.1 photosystem II protein Psb27 [Limnothrix sp. FACHB-708]